MSGGGRAVQLPLNIGLRDSATFENFYSGPHASVLGILREAREPIVYLWGPPGGGKTHLLQAACQQCAESGGHPAYLPLAEVGSLDPGLLEGLGESPLVCIDDVQAIAGNGAWESALFYLYNEVRAAGGRLAAAGDAAPSALHIGLADLRSRLGWGPVFHLQPLAEEERIAALQFRAARRGLDLPLEVATYLLRRAPRDAHSLFALLERLDEGSLAAQRRLTIPFVREFLD
jgi:DnaA family protein